MQPPRAGKRSPAHFEFLLETNYISPISRRILDLSIVTDRATKTFDTLRPDHKCSRAKRTTAEDRQPAPNRRGSCPIEAKADAGRGMLFRLTLQLNL